ncbi:type 2 isopentenyl-diphosphate Delta-isomerase [Liquorilactobacillus capillatus]|uniref:Isopentenyl-diphosphate delta-isomerase n=1 Tax=Liquorilactobacillus capillatus DSM 19910 TaxID=1423731 RepID=A0A0R1M2Y6_9LACO|nr:type 2 isopentenyl-diphosphate Delta-isomerase [Liquorilactobacillus capillatus]KRL00068.1 isopentenyl pyrophosphate isomerase [Liquorilactobacillus capillatus DSM 19910]
MDTHSHRKDEHVFIAEKLYQADSHNGLEQVKLFPHNLPEIAWDEVDITTTLAGKKIPAPFFINAMSGGSPATAKLNEKLAVAAAATSIPMATGSESIALKLPETAASFSIVREKNPVGIVLGNLGAGHTFQDAQKAIALLKADILELHLNAAQEIVMPEGDRSFKWRASIAEIAAKSTIPILVKEVGFGITPQTLQQLHEIGIKYVDLSGRGGTNFAKIENQRRRGKDFPLLDDFGLSTAETLIASQPFQTQFSFTASGGIKNALEIVKCLVLGADNVGLSGLFLHTVLKQGSTGLIELISQLKYQVQALMVLLGCHNIAELRKTFFTLSPELDSFQKQLLKK